MVHKHGFAVLWLVLTAVSSFGQALPPVEADAEKALLASSRHGEWVNVPTSEGSFQAWVVYPERPDAASVLVLIHEIFGLTPWARAVADSYAAQGYLVIAPDFLSGHAADGKGGSTALGPEASRGALVKLEPAEIYRRLDASARWATSQPAATKAFGVVGFCWGGGVAYSWATVQPGLKAVVGFYGTAPSPQALPQIQGPVLALYGGSDARVTVTLAPFRDQMNSLKKSFQSEVYEGAGHAFLRQQQGQNGANLKAAQAGWQRSLEFLKAHLDGKPAALWVPSERQGVGMIPATCGEEPKGVARLLVARSLRP